MNKLILIFFINLSFSAYAVKGKFLIQVEEIKSQSCLLEAMYKDHETLGVCSGFITVGNKLITAKHCLVQDPSSYNVSGANHWQDINDIHITCNGKRVEGISMRMHPEIDIAILTLDSFFSSEVKLATENEILNIQRNPKEYKCASFGYGLNNTNEFRKFNGVVIDDLKIYDFEEAEAEIAMDYDFKNMSQYFANSMSSKIWFNKYFFPQFFHFIKMESEEVTSVFEKFWSNYDYNYNIVYDSKVGPLAYEQFISLFKESYMLVMKEQMKVIRHEKIKMKKPLIIPVLNTSSYTDEKSGFDYGDSGGVFACEIENEWKAIAINSKAADSNRGYSSKPWEPMHYRPKNRITKNGITIPFVDLVTDWIMSE